MNFAYIENIVFEGGGIKAIAFFGVLKYLEETNKIYHIKRCIGSSAGCIFALAVICRINYQKVADIIKTKNFEDLKDDSWGYVLDIYRIYNQYGYYKGDSLFEWFGEILEQFEHNKDITFIQLYNKTYNELVITGTNVNKNQTKYFSHIHTPNVPVRLAMRISTSIPFIFKPVKFEDDFYVDGGLLNNYPLWYFDHHYNYLVCNNSEEKDKYTVGFKLLSSDESPFQMDSIHNGINFERKEIKNIFDYSILLFNSMFNQIERNYIKDGYWKRTININTGNIQGTDFNLSKEKLEWLEKQGYDACKNKITRLSV